jgi:hypothetical protein
MEKEDERERHRRYGQGGTGRRSHDAVVPGRGPASSQLPAGSNGPYQASVFVQFQAAAPTDLDSVRAHEIAARGTTSSGTMLPHLDAIQRSFGKHDVRGVRAHVGGAASDASTVLGAHAYASGDNVAFAQAPDLRLAAHEAAHVVQQRGGVRLSGGIGRAGDTYEQHADAVADTVVRGESAEALLDQHAHRGAAGGPAVQYDRRGDRSDDAVIVAPTDAHALVRYARHVRSHLDDLPGHLVPYARALDAQLRAGAFDAQPEDVIAVVDALLAIRTDLGGRRPSELAAFRTTGSPLDGMIEDIAPFGNVDMWHALRSAALERRSERRRERRDPVPPTTTTPTETPPPPATDGATIGVHGGSVSAARAGHEIADEIGRDADHTAGDWGTAIDGAGMAYDTITQFIAVAEMVEIAALAIQPVLSTISLLLSMEASWQQTQQGLRAQGMRCALASLGTPFGRYPITLHTGELVAHIVDSPVVGDWERNVRQATAYEAGGEGEPEALARVGVAEVARSVNTAVANAEAWRAIADALAAATPELRGRIQQDLRRAMYQRIYEAGAARLAGD